MITSFEVGAVFKIINEASPALRTIMKQIADLRKAIDAAKASMAELTRMPSLATATGNLTAYAEAWERVAAASSNAARAVGRANARAISGVAPGSGRVALSNRAGAASSVSHWGMFPTVATPRARSPGGSGGGAGGGGNIPWYLGGPNAHYTAPSVPLGPMGHARFGGGAAMAAAASFAWGVDQAAKTQDYVWKMEDIAGTPHDGTNDAKFRKLLENFQTTYGYNVDAAGEASLSALRQFQGVPGNGVDTLSEILAASSTEARRKGASLDESVEAGIGLAHQFKAYSPTEIRELMATFAALSTADPRSLNSIKRAAGYSVPTLSELDVDPKSVLLAGTALASAGVDSTRSGTWIREAVTRAMPGIVLGHSASNKKHEEALRKLNLVDSNGKPTWFTNGRPDQFKLLETASDALQGMSPEERAVYGRAAFGVQGFGAVSVLGDPKVNARMHAIDALTKSPKYRERYENFNPDYTAGSTVQDARRAAAEFNVSMGEIARFTLPAVNHVLGDFRSGLEAARKLMPGGDGASLTTPLARAGDGAAAGFLAGGAVGLLGGPFGAVAGAIGGAVIGGVGGVAEQYMKAHGEEQDKKQTDDFVRALKSQGTTPAAIPPPPINFSLNIDGKTIAQAIIDKFGDIYRHSTTDSGADGSMVFGP